MSSTYWVEMNLLVSSDEADADKAAFVEELVTRLDDEKLGEVMYTLASKTGHLTLMVAAVSAEPMEQVSAWVVSTVRATAHELGAGTPGWPEPVTLSDFNIKSLDREAVPC